MRGWISFPPNMQKPTNAMKCYFGEWREIVKVVRVEGGSNKLKAQASDQV
jgi:hypothetical protein